MKKRLLSAFLAVMMVLTMAPVAFAADDAENTVGDTGSSESAPAKTLQGQINEAENGATITLNDNYTEDITIPADKVITLNLNGNKLTNVQSDTITVTKGAKLTIEGAGTVDNVTHGMAAIYNNGTTTLNGGTYTRSLETGDKVTPKNSYYNILNHGIMTIDKDVTVKQNGNYSSLVANGYYNYSATEKGDRTAYIESVGQDAPQLTINNGTFSGGINTIKNDDNAILTINNGEFSNVTQAVVQNNNIATVNGGTFNAPNYHVLENRKFNGNYNAGELTVTGGNFTGSIMVTSGATTSITGGTFSSDVSAYVAEGYVQNNGTVEQLGETNAVAEVGDTYYKTLADAVAAAQDGQTVKMLNDTKVTEEISFSGKKITLDLNGKIIAGVFNDYYSVIEAQGTEATLIVEDNSNGAQGKITSNHYGLTGRDDGSIIVNSGMIETGDGAALSGNNTTGNMNFTVNGGTLTTKSGPAIYQPGQCKLTITGGTLNGGISLRMGQVNISGGTINAATENLDSPAQYYNYSGNAWLPDALYVFGGTYNSTDSTYGNSLNLNITGGTFNCNNGQGSAIAIYDIGKVAQAAKITISGDAKLATTTSNRKAYDVLSLSDIGVTNPDTGYGNKNLVGKVSTAISGGYFTSDPSDYCADNLTGVSSGNTTYPWTVGEKSADTKPAEVAAATVAATVDKSASEAAQDAAKEIGGAMMTQNEAIKAAAKDEANKNTIDADTLVGGKTVTQKLQEVDPTITSDKVKIVYQTYIDVEVKDAAKENSTFTELTVELTPMYRVIAAKSGVTDYHVDVDKNTPEAINAVQIVGEQPLTLTGKYEVTLQLPNGFVVPSDNKLSIKHQKSSGVEYYTGTVDTTSGTKMVTFETNGFSPFTISAVAAYVGTTAYPTLQEAANAANSGDTIVVKNGASHDLTFTATKSVKVKNETGAAVTVKFNGTDKKFGNGETETFSYTKPSSSSGGSSSGKTTFKVVTSAVNNGGVNASPSNAEKGATITITLSPDKGYKLDKLTVTDGSGKTVSTVKKSDTVYTFTMPASAVKVGVSYVKATETPSETKFNDVSANDWFASAVDYVTGKGMMNGTADNTFSPKANTTRGMVVTVLYRLENQPSTSAASFTDVASGAYYANAVAWANANGIVSGYGSGKFGPNDKVTREQLAAILYRYAQYKKYDVSVGEDTNILSYDDAQSISSYAIPAIQWACGAGVVTGKSGSKLDPKGNATRAEVAAMLMRFCENVK